MYYYSYALRIPQKVSDALAIGIVGHAVLAEYCMGLMGSNDGSTVDEHCRKAAERYKELWESELYMKGKGGEETNKENAVRDLLGSRLVGTSLVMEYIRAMHGKIRPALVETQFSRTTTTGIDVIGIVDLVCDTGLVVDWKFTSRADVQYENDPQATMYAWLMGGSAQFEYHVLRRGSTLVPDIRQAHRTPYDTLAYERDTIGPVGSAIRNRQFPRIAPPGRCRQRFCAYKEICAADDGQDMAT